MNRRKFLKNTTLFTTGFIIGNSVFVDTNIFKNQFANTSVNTPDGCYLRMSDYWEISGRTKPQSTIVCAACKYNDIIICGVRHWDKIMNKYRKSLNDKIPSGLFEQGFVDQFGDFHNRGCASAIVKANGQPFDEDRNGSDTELYSEGLY